MIKYYTKKQAEDIIEKTMISFGLQENMKTNPQIINNVLKEFKLDDFQTTHKIMHKLFKDIVSKPQDLQPMFENIKKGLLTKHPAIIEFAELAIEKNWFKPSQHVIRSIHVTYVLEILTAAMCNSHDFFIEVQDHYKKKEQSLGLNTSHIFSTFTHALRISHDYFKIAKAFSLDPLMIYLKIQRGLTKSHLKNTEVQQLLKNKKINYLEYKLLSPLHKNGIEHINELVKINIYEAGITEYKKGLKTNAICAHILSKDIDNNPPHTLFQKKSVVPENNTNAFYNSITESENLFPVIRFSQDWTSLYTTWNMSFVLGNLNDLDIVFPKLLIPSIIDSESENFMSTRFISLWLSINHVIFRTSKKIEVAGPKNKADMAKAWAKINKKYAFDLAKREMHEDSKTLMKNYNKFFSHPVRNFFKLVKIFFN